MLEKVISIEYLYLPKVSRENLKTFFFQRFLTLDDRKLRQKGGGQKSETWPIFPCIYLNFEFFDEN